MVEFKLVCLGTEEHIEQAFISGEDKSIFETDNNLIYALVDLIIAYYVFHVSYPDALSGLLYFLQDVALEVKDTASRTIKYSTFMAELCSDVHTA